MWFLAGFVIGAVVAASLMMHWLGQGWLHSEWYDAWIDDALARAARGEPVIRDWQ